MNTTIEIPQPDLREITVTIKGRTPLITHNGDSAVDKIAEMQSGPKARGPRLARDPDAEYREGLYEIEPGRYGFPGAGIKKALKHAGMRFTDEKGTIISGAIQIVADLVEIEDGVPYMRRDRVRLNGRTTSVAYRPCFPKWVLRVPVVYNAGIVAQEQVLNLFQIAGFAIGLGNWRPECNGTFGQFAVEGAEV